MSTTNTFRSAVGAGWTVETLCPECGGPTEDTLRRMPRFRCLDSRCPMQFGYRIRPLSDDALVAVPLTPDTVKEIHTGAVPWPRNQGRKLTDEDYALLYKTAA